jgi:hypothetical protein
MASTKALWTPSELQLRFTLQESKAGRLKNSTTSWLFNPMLVCVACSSFCDSLPISFLCAIVSFHTFPL